MTVLDTAADVLRCFSADRHELTVTEVSNILSLPKSNVSRLLRAMRDAGFLDTVGNSKRYRPGVLLHEAGLIYRFASSLIDRAHAVVAGVCAETGHTGYVSERDGHDVLAVTECPGTNALRVASSIGRRLAAFASATGRSLLARMDDEEIRHLYSDPLDPPSPTAPQTMAELFARLAAIRRDGFAESSDEANRGVGALAVAVGDPETGEAVSLCVVYPVAVITEDERRLILTRLSEGAAEIAAITRDPLFVPLSPAFRRRAS